MSENPDPSTGSVQEMGTQFDWPDLGHPPKHLEAYLNEMTFRFNNRSNPYLFRDTLIRLLERRSWSIGS